MLHSLSPIAIIEIATGLTRPEIAQSIITRPAKAAAAILSGRIRRPRCGSSRLGPKRPGAFSPGRRATVWLRTPVQLSASPDWTFPLAISGSRPEDKVITEYVLESDDNARSFQADLDADAKELNEAFSG